MYKAPLAVAALAAFCAASAVAENGDRNKAFDHSKIKHVLLISIDGFHAVDYLNCSHGVSSIDNGAPYCPNLSSIGSTAINYTAASTSKPSDSFPGLMNIVSGATPRTMGVYYDVGFDRTYAGPQIPTGNGNPAGTGCTPGQVVGWSAEFDEGIDLDQTELNGGAPGAGLTDGGIASLDPKKLDLDPNNNCKPVYPWNFVRVNTVFGVIHKAGGYTAWSDKHPSYSSVGGNTPGNVDDYFSPEINSTVIPVPGLKTASGLDCSSVVDPTSDTSAWTNSFQNIQCYDQIKVNAILNEIEGKDHDGHKATVPNIFGMNFQAVSVGEKLIEGSSTGGYLDAAGTPGPSLLSEIKFVDQTLGQMLGKIKQRGLYESTLIIVTSKHGQSPIDPNRYDAVPGKTNNGESPETILEAAGYIPLSETGAHLGPAEDDVSLLWLKSTDDIPAAVQLIEQNGTAEGLGQIYFGPTLALNYNNPGLPPDGDPRTPDIIVTPNVGVTYTGSNSKLAEHGGFSHDDTNVVLLVSNPAISPRTVFNAVSTTQVAPTILGVFGLDPNALDGVRKDGTPILPFISGGLFPDADKK